MRSLDFASLRSTVSIINRSLDKLEMPPSVSVFGFRDQPVWLMEDKPVRLLDDMRDVSTSVDIREIGDLCICGWTHYI